MPSLTGSARRNIIRKWKVNKWKKLNSEFEEKSSHSVTVGKLLDKGLKERQRIIETGITCNNTGGAGGLPTVCSFD